MRLRARVPSERADVLGLWALLALAACSALACLCRATHMHRSCYKTVISVTEWPVIRFLAKFASRRLPFLALLIDSSDEPRHNRRDCVVTKPGGGAGTDKASLDGSG